MNDFLDISNPLRRKAKGKQSAAETLQIKKRAQLESGETQATWWEKVKESYADIENPTWGDVGNRLTDPVFLSVNASRNIGDMLTSTYDLLRTHDTGKYPPEQYYMPGAQEFGVQKLYREVISPLIQEMQTTPEEQALFVETRARPLLSFLGTDLPKPRSKEEIRKLEEKVKEQNPITEAIINSLTKKYRSEKEFKKALANNPFEVAEDIATVVAPHLRATKIPRLARAADILESLTPDNLMSSIPLAMAAFNPNIPKHKSIAFLWGNFRVDDFKRLAGFQTHRWDKAPDIYYSYGRLTDRKNRKLGSTKWERTTKTSGEMKNFLKTIDSPDRGLIHVYEGKPGGKGKMDVNAWIGTFEAKDILPAPTTNTRLINTEDLKPNLRRKTPTISRYKNSLTTAIREKIGNDKLKEWTQADDVFYGVYDEWTYSPAPGERNGKNGSILLYVSKDLNEVVTDYMRNPYGIIWGTSIEIVPFRVERGVSFKAEPQLLVRSVDEELVERLESVIVDTMEIPRINLIDGKQVKPGNFKEWDADADVYYRITNSERLNQPYSHEFGVANEMEDEIIAAMIDRKRGRSANYEPKRSYADYVNDDGEMMSLTEIKAKYGAKGTTKEYWYWKDYSELAEELFNVKLQVHADKYFFRGAADAGAERAKFRYNGVNAIERIGDAMSYRRQYDWDEYANAGGGKGVLQVFEGEYIGEAYSGDGAVVIPIKTIGVFELNTMK